MYIILKVKSRMVVHICLCPTAKLKKCKLSDGRLEAVPVEKHITEQRDICPEAGVAPMAVIPESRDGVYLSEVKQRTRRVGNKLNVGRGKGGWDSETKDLE